MMTNDNRVAIIGMAGIFPEADTLDEFAANLRTGKDSVRPLSATRMALTGIEANDQYQVTGYIERPDSFDYRFFNLSKREAENMDPAHRMVLQLSCQAIWNAGYKLQDFYGKNTCVMIGGKSFPKYLFAFEEFDATAYSGNMASMTAGRVSYLLNLTGSSLMIDTSCSSSLVAVHEACQKILLGESDTALAGGFGNIVHFHEKGENNSLGVISSSGKCRAFDAAADGIGLGEGGGIVLLKKLDQAIHDGDTIHAIILGSAVNHDGFRSNGLTAPSPAAQTEVITKAWKKAGIEPSSISFIEAHGTGTKLGDPIEFKGITDAFAAFTNKTAFCAISSVKTNIGHLDNAAGIAGLFKSILALKNKELYPNINYEIPNTFLDFSQSAVYVNDKLRPWIRNGTPLRCGVSSFGLSGTNVHMVLEEAAGKEKLPVSVNEIPALLKVSAKTAASLKNYRQGISHYLQKHPDRLSEIVPGLNTGRDDYEYRNCLPFTDAEELIRQLATDHIPARPNRVPLLILLFSDMEIEVATWKRLLEKYPPFARFYTGIKEEIPANLDGKLLPGFLLQVGLYHACGELGLHIHTIIATGAGKIAKQTALQEISIVDAIARIQQYHQSADAPDARKLQQALQQLNASEDIFFLEAGYSGTLGRLIGNVSIMGTVVDFLSENGNAENAIARLYEAGFPVNWQAIYNPKHNRSIELPGYSFEATSCWVKNKPIKKDTSAAQWFHQLRWEQAPTSTMLLPEPGAMFVLVGNDQLIADLAVPTLQAAGIEYVQVTAGEGFHKKSNKDYKLAFQKAEVLQLFQALQEEYAHKIAGILFFDLEGAIAVTNTTQKPYLSEELYDIPFLFCQAFSSYFTKQDFLLANITTGALSIDGKVSRPWSAALTGFYRAILSEYPGLRVKNIDLPATTLKEENLIPQLLTELLREQPFTDVLMQHGISYRPVLARLKPDAAQARDQLSFPQGGAYLITGGAGGIGFELAKAIAIHAESIFFITGRTVMPDRADWELVNNKRVREKIDNLLLLEKMGATVYYIASDSCDAGAMKQVATMMKQTAGRLHGVIHAAGIGIRQIPLPERSILQFRETLAPKIAGTLQLQRCIEDLTPSFFVCCSSLNALIPAAKSSDYALANSFMDSFCRFQSSQTSCRYISLQWPGWKETGMITRKAGPRPDDSGEPIRLIRNADGVQAFYLALTMQQPLLAIGDIDYTFFKSNPFFDIHSTPTVDSTLPGALPAVQSVTVFPADQLLSPVERKLSAIWNEVLKTGPVKPIDDFFDLGGNSLNGRQVITRINKQFGVEIDFDVIFDYGTLQELAGYIEQLQQEQDAQEDPIRIEKVSEQEYYELSHAQKRLWILAQFEPDSITYNLPAAYQIEEGNFNPEAFEKAIQWLIDRHESFRTIFKVINGEPKQYILRSLTVSIPATDISHLHGNELEVATRNHYQQEASRRFNLEEGPLFSFSLLKQSSSGYLICYNMHHIVTDGWSQGIIENEILTAYNAFKNGAVPANRPPGMRYRDYSTWHNKLIGAGYFSEMGQYWTTKFQDHPKGIDLPLDLPRSSIQTFNGGRVFLSLDKQASTFFKETLSEQGTTMFMNILTLVGILLYKYSGQKDMIIGSPAAGRSNETFHDVVGFFVNTLVYRWKIDPKESFLQLLARVKKEAIEVYNHMDYPFDLLVEQMAVGRDLSHSPLFNVMLVHNNTQRQDHALLMDDVDIDSYTERYKLNISRFDLVFFMSENVAGIDLLLEYNSDLFRADTIHRMAANLKQLATAVSLQPHEPLGQVSCLAPEEYALVMETFQGPQLTFPEGTLVSLFEQQVAVTPEATAVVYEKQTLTYRQLKDLSDRLAKLLQRRGVGRTTLVPVCFERGVDMIIAMLGIMKAGGAYVPIDPTYPKHRIDFILKDCLATLVLTTSGQKDIFQDIPGISLLQIETAQELTATAPANDKLTGPSSADLAYIIYTSGSTGLPKGVMIEHRSAVNLVYAQTKQFGIRSDERIMQFSNYCFDASVEQIFLALLNGAMLVMMPRELEMNPGRLRQLIMELGVTHLHATPAFLESLTIREQTALKRVIAGGDVCSPRLPERWRNKVDFYNEYGPTETTVTAVEYLVKGEEAMQRSLPIGNPLINMRAYVLDESKQPVPIGVTGELHLGGVQVARGYLNREALTAEKFIQDHFNTDPDARLYCTGDYCRWLPEGGLEFIGRIDGQVKIRGYRIELGEIEAILIKAPGVKQAIVAAVEDKKRVKRLVAYIVPENQLDNEPILAYCKERLPDYMIPAILMQIEAVPMTVHGKMDREKLPPVDVDSMIEGSFEAPRTNTELEIAAIWRELLGLKKVGINDNFFVIGGHSIRATQVLNRVYKKMKARVSLLQFFRNPTIRMLGALVDAATPVNPNKINKAPVQDMYPLSYAQQQMWMADQYMHKRTGVYNAQMAYELTGQLDLAALERSFFILLERHEGLRTAFVEQGGAVWQRIIPMQELKWGIQYRDLSTAGNQKEDLIQNALHTFTSIVFDLQIAPLFAVLVIKQDENRHLFKINCHHIIFDGWSMFILLRELVTLYNYYTENTGTGFSLTELPLQYTDYAWWYHKMVETDGFATAKAFWKKKLEDIAPHAAELPADFRRSLRRTYSGHNFSCNLDNQLITHLREVAAERQLSVYNIMLAAVNILVYHHTGVGDVVLGTEVHGRNDAGLENVIGFFVNTLILRNQVRHIDTLEEVLQKVAASSFESIEHQAYPLDRIKNDLAIDFIENKNPLFNVEVSYVLNVSDIDSLNLKGLQVAVYPQPSITSHFDMTISIYDSEQGININFVYNTDLYTPATIERYCDQLQLILAAFAADINQSVHAIPFTNHTEANSGLNIQFNF